jgi:hypothetical protein
MTIRTVDAIAIVAMILFIVLGLMLAGYELAAAIFG